MGAKSPLISIKVTGALRLWFGMVFCATQALCLLWCAINAMIRIRRGLSLKTAQTVISAPSWASSHSPPSF